ncbi:MAG TPA: HNH endonuclease signature motif containing protein, partial [Iamia sp.]|nr:HNH endonuclease signature motif containing protein [Iamia sp.]
VEHRDGGCRVPGCDSQLWIEVHHIVHWEDHGDTITENLICLCRTHHRLHHQGLLGITGNADAIDGITFTTATGMVLRPAGRPTEPSALPPVEPYDGPTGERLQKHWVTFSRRPLRCVRGREPAAPGPGQP